MLSVQPDTASSPPPKVPAPSNATLNCCWSAPIPSGKTWKFIWPDTLPEEVTCINKTRKSASGNPLEAVFKMYQEAPVKVLLKSVVAPSFKKNGVMGWLLSSTMLGSAAPSSPDDDAGPSKPMVA